MLEICQQCKAFHASEACVFQCPTIFDKSRRYKWKEFKEFLLENGNSIKELRQQEGSFDEFKIKFLSKLSKYKKHFFVYR